MTIIANTSVKLDAHSPKKDAVVTQLAPVAGVNEVGVWIPTGANLNLAQFYIGSLQNLCDMALTQLKDGPVLLVVPIGGGDPQIVIDGIAPVSGEVGLYIGADLAAKGQSHFIKRTFDRVIERLLEEGK
jgi:hypothetical protein